jgi:hypothetical protein
MALVYLGYSPRRVLLDHSVCSGSGFLGARGRFDGGGGILLLRGVAVCQRGAGAT